MNFTEGAGGYDINITTSQNAVVYTNVSWLPAIQYIMVKDFEKILEWDYEMLTRSTEFVATECALEMCAEWLQESVINSTLHTTVQRSVCGWDYTLDVPSDFALALNSSDGSEFSLTHEAWEALSIFVSTIFGGAFHTVSDVASWVKNEGVSFDYATVDTTQAIFYGNFSGCSGQEDDHLTCAVNNTAKAITKTFRDEAYIKSGLVGGNVTVGQTMVMASFVRIDWVWLSLPLAVWLAAAVLWAATTWKTRKARLPSWNNNILPFLFLAKNPAHNSFKEIDGNVAAGAAGVSNRAFLDESKKITVRLRVADTRAHLE